MFQSIYEVKVVGKDVKRFLKKAYLSGIYFENIDFKSKCVYLKLTKENYIKLKNIRTIYKVELVRLYGIIKLIDIIKTYKIFLISLIFGYIYIIFLSNIIFDVDVIHSKKEIRNLIYKELNEYGIKKYNFVKTYKEKEKIESKILENYKDKLEWIEIDRIGTKYKIRVEERIMKTEKDEKPPMNIIASKDGIIMKIQADKGEIRKKINDYVKKGEVIISGEITKDDEIKNKVAASGRVYAEVWYQTSIDMPYYYKEIKYLDRQRKVLKLKFMDKDYYFFNRYKYNNYIEENIFSVKNNMLPISINYSKEKETIVIEKLYTPEEAIEEAQAKSYEKIKAKLKLDERILKQKVIEVNEYENYVNVVMFYKIYEDITFEEEIKDIIDDKESH